MTPAELVIHQPGLEAIDRRLYNPPTCEMTVFTE